MFIALVVGEPGGEGGMDWFPNMSLEDAVVNALGVHSIPASAQTTNYISNDMLVVMVTSSSKYNNIYKNNNISNTTTHLSVSPPSTPSGL